MGLSSSIVLTPGFFPGNAPPGKIRLFWDSSLKAVDDAGVITDLGGGVGTNIITFAFNLAGEAIRNRFLSFGEIPSNVVGYPVVRPGKVVSLAATVSQASSGTIVLQKRNAPDQKIELVLAGETIQSLDNLDFIVAPGDYLQVFASTGIDQSFANPTVVVFMT